MIPWLTGSSSRRRGPPESLGVEVERSRRNDLDVRADGTELADEFGGTADNAVGGLSSRAQPGRNRGGALGGHACDPLGERRRLADRDALLNEAGENVGEAAAGLDLAVVESGQEVPPLCDRVARQRLLAEPVELVEEDLD